MNQRNVSRIRAVTYISNIALQGGKAGQGGAGRQGPGKWRRWLWEQEARRATPASPKLNASPIPKWQVGTRIHERRAIEGGVQ